MSILDRKVTLRNVRNWWLIGFGISIVMHFLGQTSIETVGNVLWFQGGLFLTLLVVHGTSDKEGGQS